MCQCLSVYKGCTMAVCTSLITTVCGLVTVWVVYVSVSVCVQGVYNVCMYKFDHYCVWIGNCVGGLNHRYFLALLLSLTAMCCHGVWSIVKVFTAVVTVYQLSNASTYQLFKVLMMCLICAANSWLQCFDAVAWLTGRC